MSLEYVTTHSTIKMEVRTPVGAFDLLKDNLRVNPLRRGVLDSEAEGDTESVSWVEAGCITREALRTIPPGASPDELPSRNDEGRLLSVR